MTTPSPLTDLPAAAHLTAVDDPADSLTPVRICLLSCSHVQWMPQSESTEGVWYCLCCNAKVLLRYYIDEMAVDA
jgi:hypothetical protein